MPPGSILVTGGTSGLGYYSALEIARQKPESHVFIASRTDKYQAAKSMNEALGQNNVSFVPLDLASLEKVRQFAKAWAERNEPPVQLLLLNAGIQEVGAASTTTDGFDSTFAVNHLGHALLFYLLLPHLAPDARIVVTASGVHDPAQKWPLPDAKYSSAEALAHPSPEDAQNGGKQFYTSSKLCNVLWTYALHRRLSKLTEKGMTVVAFCPGVMPGTGLANEYSGAARVIWSRVLPVLAVPILRIALSPNAHTAKDSGASLAWVAMNSEARTKSGVYFEGRKEVRSSEDSYKEEYQEDLWNWTIKTVSGPDEVAWSTANASHSGLATQLS